MLASNTARWSPAALSSATPEGRTLTMAIPRGREGVQCQKETSAIDSTKELHATAPRSPSTRPRSKCRNAVVGVGHWQTEQLEGRLRAEGLPERPQHGLPGSIWCSSAPRKRQSRAIRACAELGTAQRDRGANQGAELD